MSRMAHGGLNAQAIAVIENACLDIKAKALGIPVYALFGGPFRERIPLYWSHCGSRRVWRRDLFEGKWGFPPLHDLDDVVQLGRTVVERGFKALKTNPCDLMPGWTKFSSGFRPMPGFLDRRPDSQYMGEITQLLAAFRDGIGPETGLMLDLNFNQRTDGFIKIARAVEPYGLTWLEIDIHDPEALALVRQSSRTPIGSLETIHGLSANTVTFSKSRRSTLRSSTCTGTAYGRRCGSPRWPMPTKSTQPRTTMPAIWRA